MPPKSKFTREEVISAATEITAEQGLSAVTARELGIRLGSSSRPVFTLFKNMEEVWNEVIKRAYEIYDKYIQEGLADKIPFRGTGMAYIKFANENPRLFRLLFMEERPETASFTPYFADPHSSEIEKLVSERYNISSEKAKKLYSHLTTYCHGLAVYCCSGLCNLSYDNLAELLSEAFESFMMKIQNNSD